MDNRSLAVSFFPAGDIVGTVMSSSTLIENNEQTKWQMEAVLEGVLSADDPEALYEDLRVIGHGSTADILRATDKRTGDFVAIKRFKAGTKEEEARDIVKEIKFMREVQHANVIKIHGAYLQRNQVWLILDYCAGSCFDILDVFKSPFAEPEIAAVTLFTLHGLAHLHGIQRIHRDIKCGNILLTDEAEVRTSFIVSTVSLA